jgi:hypothetical protein
MAIYGTHYVGKPRKEEVVWRRPGFEVFYPRLRVHTMNPGLVRSALLSWLFIRKSISKHPACRFSNGCLATGWSLLKARSARHLISAVGCDWKDRCRRW